MTLNKLKVPLACALVLLLAGAWAMYSHFGNRASAPSTLRDDAVAATAPAPPPPAAGQAQSPPRLPQRSFIEDERKLITLGVNDGGGPDAPVREGDVLQVLAAHPKQSGRYDNSITDVTNGSINLQERDEPIEILTPGGETTIQKVTELLSQKLATAGADKPVVRVTKVRWEDNPKTIPDPAIKAAAEGAVVLPMVTATKINKRDPDVVMHGIIAGRTWEEFGFMRFDLSSLKSPPKKATFHASCYMLENTRGVQTPGRLVFYVVKTAWDDTATYNFARSSTRVSWPEGTFNPNSPLNVDPTPVATIEMPNPPPPGYNVSFDVTEVVADWVTGKQPNFGLMLRVDQAPGYSYQANLSSFDYRKKWVPKIICVPADAQ